MGTKNNPGAFDCYANAEPDEPMFTLLGRDEQAPELVRLWAKVRARSGEDPTKVQEAYDCADAMDAWRKANRPDPDEVDAAAEVAPLTSDELRAMLMSTLCLCGRAKKTMNSFCQGDYWKLDPTGRNTLYRSIGAGYEEAFAAAMEKLKLGPADVAKWRADFAAKYQNQ